MGVWIETTKSELQLRIQCVTPCMGVWIETYVKSLNVTISQVTPCMGVWIETLNNENFDLIVSHTLYGCVD